ncbi:oligoribonuclease-like [Leptopilina heterotoma]|uniref:oligoribonuclease-like n=1 Tax=Leptopilina heterotoma TaxID=63436 RepID=UPI001CA89F1F|nr:oligoribonuclease-like [Leptopilina heterotoma]
MTLKKSDFIVWIDMEKTGLDPLKDRILELACIITDGNLKTVSDEFHVVIHQSDEVLDNMDTLNRNRHKTSGLIDVSRRSEIKNCDAETKLLEFLQKYISKRTCPLAGNSVCMDRLFLTTQMPLVNDYLHYHIIDVSSLKELVRRWQRSKYRDKPPKYLCPRALYGVKESIEVLEYYRKCLFQPESQ